MEAAQYIILCNHVQSLQHIIHQTTHLFAKLNCSLTLSTTPTSTYTLNNYRWSESTSNKQNTVDNLKLQSQDANSPHYITLDVYIKTTYNLSSKFTILLTFVVNAWSLFQCAYTGGYRRVLISNITNNSNLIFITWLGAPNTQKVNGFFWIQTFICRTMFPDIYQ